ncbi:hypothetical protein PENSPDRAFT_748368 [Peniophora sp. CONT]|nr:hypothetical protein PENSPDRAFT_748368 [Peniophora sp. CONT]
MKFTSTITALAAVLAVEGTSRLDTRQSSECAGAAKTMAAYDRPFVYPLFEACAKQLGTSAPRRENPWLEKMCVAAAVSASLPVFHDGLTCNLNTSEPVELTDASTWPSLDSNVYASIVGSSDGKITQQNFIDLVYSTISETTGGPYPDSAETLVDYYIKPIFDWAAFDLSEGIPYTNFNDWLHYSPTITHCDPTQCA